MVENLTAGLTLRLRALLSFKAMIRIGTPSLNHQPGGARNRGKSEHPVQAVGAVGTGIAVTTIKEKAIKEKVAVVDSMLG